MKKLVNGVESNMTPDEVDAFERNKPVPDVALDVRLKRNRLLADTDWMALSDNTMTPEWASYRQALRDITGQTGFPYSVNWPTKPE